MSKPYMPPAKSQEWETPWYLFERLDREFGFTVDAAASRFNAKCERYWTKEDDGLSKSWRSETVFVNPPFAAKDLKLWPRKAHEESRQKGTIVVMVVPVKSDQVWWHDYAIRSQIRFIRGRIRFEGAKNHITLPVAVLIFGLDYGSKMLSMGRGK